MLTKISKANQIKLLKFITNPVINSTLVLNKKQSIECIEGTCEDCMFSINHHRIKKDLRHLLYNKQISCFKAKCIELDNAYKLIEK